MQTLDTADAMMAWADAAHHRGETLGLVPTMGYLHEGHLSLMRRLRPKVDRLIVSIYVNPLQFGPNEDLDRYPRDLEGDLEKCRSVGVDAVFTPEDIYPPGFATTVSMVGLTDGLCGATRPGHFDGVTTVVARLFGLTRCDWACFGEKDFQQLAVIRRLVTDLAIPVRIEPGPIVRDHDGLALSSRNKFLDETQRQRSLTLHAAVDAVAAAWRDGVRDTAALLALGRERIDADRIDYFDIVDAASLQPVTRVEARPARVLVAAFYGGTRLIDNGAVGPEPSWT